MVETNAPKIYQLVAEAFGAELSFVSESHGQTLCQKLHLTVVDEFTHKFAPQGFTQVFVLSESHLAIHAWPESGYLHFDLVTCSSEVVDASVFESAIREIYQPQTVKVSVVEY